MDLGAGQGSDNEVSISASDTEDAISVSVPVDDEGFETLAAEIREVLAELAQDKAMDAFRFVYCTRKQKSFQLPVFKIFLILSLPFFFLFSVLPVTWFEPRSSSIHNHYLRPNAYLGMSLFNHNNLNYNILLMSRCSFFFTRLSNSSLNFLFHSLDFARGGLPAALRPAVYRMARC